VGGVVLQPCGGRGAGRGGEVVGECFFAPGGDRGVAGEVSGASLRKKDDEYCPVWDIAGRGKERRERQREEEEGER